MDIPLHDRLASQSKAFFDIIGGQAQSAATAHSSRNYLECAATAASLSAARLVNLHISQARSF